MPNIIKREAMRIAGTCGDGAKTAQIWQEFEQLCAQEPLADKLDENGYEVRIFGEDTVHVGSRVRGDARQEGYAPIDLPAGLYASFDVYVANGYESENDAMDEWLRDNPQGYRERLLGDAHFCVEFYDERFCGEEAGSIVEIWIPIEKGDLAPNA